MMLVSVVFCIAGCSGTRTVSSQRVGPALEEPIAWLPADTETLVVSRHYTAKPRQGYEATTQELIDGLAFVGLPGNDRQIPPYEFVVDGSRNYRLPRNLGIGSYDGCKIILLRSDSYEATKRRFEKMATGHLELNGRRVDVLDTTEDGDPWSYYYFFDARLMFCATSKQYLAEVLSRRANRSTHIDLLDNFPLWQYVDSDAAFWALRRFTPHSDDASLLHDESLTGYAISLDKTRKLLTVVSVSTNPKGDELAAGLWESVHQSERAPAPLSHFKVDQHTTKFLFDAQAPNGQVLVFVLFEILGHPIFV